MSNWLWFIIANSIYLLFVAVMHIVNCVTRNEDGGIIVSIALLMFGVYTFLTVLFLKLI